MQSTAIHSDGHHAHHDHHHAPPARGPQLAQAALIGGTGAMLLVKVYTNTLPLYVHVRYTPLITATGLLLVGMALVQLWLTFRPAAHHHDDHDGHDHSPITWRSPALYALLVPVVLGLLIPPKALGSAAINAQGFSNTGTGMRTAQTLAGTEGANSVMDTSQWTLLDYVNALIYNPTNPQLQGKPIETTGFVWRNAEMPENQFYVARFVVSCCSADGLAIYLPVTWQTAPDLANDSWVRVRGTIGLETIQGQETAVINAEEIIPIEQPPQPYLYP